MRNPGIPSADRSEGGFSSGGPQTAEGLSYGIIGAIGAGHRALIVAVAVRRRYPEEGYSPYLRPFPAPLTHGCDDIIRGLVFRPKISAPVLQVRKRMGCPRGNDSRRIRCILAKRGIWYRAGHPADLLNPLHLEQVTRRAVE